MKKYNFKLVSPLLIAGVLAILLPIFTFMVMDRLERQKDFFYQRLLEKGSSLIRTFEAGTRIGMFRLQWGAGRIQAMLIETSMQPEIIYMMITSKNGKILAHSDTSMVGQIYKAMPEVAKATSNHKMIYHRLRNQADGVEYFEVVKRFVPVRAGFMRRSKQKHFINKSAANKQNMGWCQPYMLSFEGKMPEAAEHYIFAGLSMERERIARDRLLKETIWQGFFFFVLGCAGIFALFAFQAYRSTRASLDSVKAFSDNVIQNMPAGLITINSDRKITSMNKAAKEILDKKITDPYPQMIELIEEMEKNHKVLSQEINLTISDNSNIRLDVTASPIESSENEATEFLFLFRDLTQIKELKKQVETNKRLAAIGKLAAGVAHEVRNPLSSIKGFVTYLGKKYEDNSSEKETTKVVVREVERIDRSITQLLEFAKPMTVNKTDININDLILHSLKLVQNDFDQKKIETKVNITTEKVMIYTDSDRMNQVLLNLYINAIEAMKTEGRLEVSVSDIEENEFIKIRIRDNGPGIDNNLLDQIFDPYFTTKSTGTGLGLSIVHRIIETLSGTIHVESTKGEGTCFIITIPALLKDKEQ